MSRFFLLLSLIAGLCFVGCDVEQTLEQLANSVAPQRAAVNPQQHIAVIGDGTLAYILALTLRYMFGMPRNKLMVLGIDKDKLGLFNFAATIDIARNQTPSIQVEPQLIFECVGGGNSHNSINMAVEMAGRGASVMLMGVSEGRIPINTRDVLEKGLNLIGCSRSPHTQYAAVLKAMRNPGLQNSLRRIISGTFSCANIREYTRVFEYVAGLPTWSKVNIQFKWPAGTTQKTGKFAAMARSEG